MFRRYNRWQSRFDQPDPYDGGYNMGDPQSFNRYAYVQGDPVNLVDPSGLSWKFPDITQGGVPSAFWGWGNLIDPPRRPGRQVIDEAEYDHDYRYLPENGPFRFRSAFLGSLWFGQSPGRDEKEINDCKTMADMIQTIANMSNSITELLDTMARTFTAEATRDSSISEMNRTQNMRARINFGDRGFKLELQDGGNQVRHFVAGFIAGAKAAPFEWYARQRMNARENPRNPLDRADINLNNISTTLSGAYGVDLALARKYFARAIRLKVCQ